MRKYTYEIGIVCMLVFILASCGVKTKSAGAGGSGLVQIFTKGKDSLLCFAGPTEYNGIGISDEFEIDHTYLKVKDHSNPVTCNFSLISHDATLRPSKVSIQLGTETFTTDSLTKLYAEGRDKKDYIYRYSFQVSDSFFYKWMQTPRPILKVNDRAFEGGKEFRKDSDVIFRRILFDIY